MPATIKIGTRGSELALWQAHHVADLLRAAYPDTTVEIVTFTTKGDKILDKSLPEIGGKGLFTEELERALLAGEIDCAVHSLKDLPTEQPNGLVIGAVPKRGAVEDVLISKHNLTLDNLPQGAKIGTSSLRRAAQLRHYRSDFQIIDIRGNVPTRIAKALNPDSGYDAIVLAQAGVERLGLMDKVTQIIPLEIMLPAPGQGAIGVQCRNIQSEHQLFSKISDFWATLETTTERAFLNRLGAGCSMPLAAYLERIHDPNDVYGGTNTITFMGRVLSVDGSQCVAINIMGGFFDTQNLPNGDIEGLIKFMTSRAIEDAIKQGADKILEEVKHDIAE
jgi:hydroxymethylbilane synthase